MCHESTSVALDEAIGIGKGSVSLEDIHQAELIVIAGQNPGTNHPRMLTALEMAKKNGAKIIAINPLREAGLVRFKNPQKVRGLVGTGTGLADLFLPVRVNGDLALFQAIGALLLEWGCVDKEFIAEYTTGFDEWAEHAARPRLGRGRRRATGLERSLIEEAAGMFADSAGDHHLLGDGDHPAPQRRRDGQGDRQRRPAPGQHRQAGRRAVPGPRPLQRAGRPHDGHLGEAAGPFPRRAARRRSASSRRASTASTPSAAIQALRDGKARVFMGDGRQLRRPPPPTPR